MSYSRVATELPGILHRLITLCPDGIENGLRPPASGLPATVQLFTDLSGDSAMSK